MKTATVETISTGLNFIFTLDFTLYTRVFNQHCWLHPMRKRAPALLSVGGKPSSRRGCIILVHTTLHMISISTEYPQNSQRDKVTLLHLWLFGFCFTFFRKYIYLFYILVNSSWLMAVLQTDRVWCEHVVFVATSVFWCWINSRHWISVFIEQPRLLTFPIQNINLWIIVNLTEFY